MATDENRQPTKQASWKLTPELIDKINDEAHSRRVRWPAHVVEDHLRFVFGMPLIHSQVPGQPA